MVNRIVSSNQKGCLQKDSRLQKPLSSSFASVLDHQIAKRSRGRKPQSFHRFIDSDDVNQISIRIPNKFTREHRKHILLNDVVIIVSDDNVWSLGWMISGDGKLCLQNGWPEFAEHYRLKSGYLLIFDHCGKSVFHVRIFDRNSCEITYAPSICQEIEEPAIEDDQTMVLALFAPSGCVKHEISSSGAGAGGGKKPFFKTSDDDDDSLQKVRKLTRVLRKSYHCHLPLNTGFCKANRISGCKYIRLRNDEGKIWKVEIIKYKSKTSGRRILPHLTRGWLDFRKDNDIKIGDICEIHHVKGNLLHVHVIKKK